MTNAIAVLPKQAVSYEPNQKQKTAQKDNVHQKNSFGQVLQKTNHAANEKNPAQKLNKNGKPVQNETQAVTLPGKEIITGKAETSGKTAEKIEALLQQLQKLLRQLEGNVVNCSKDGLLGNVKKLQSLLTKLESALTPPEHEGKRTGLPNADSKENQDLLAQLSEWLDGNQMMVNQMIQNLEPIPAVKSEIAVQTSGAKPVQSLPAKEAQVINELNKTIEKAIGQLNTILQSKAGPIQNNTPVQSSSAGIPIQTLQTNTKASPKQPPDVPSLIKNDESGQVKSDRKESNQVQTNVFQSGPMNKLAQLSFHQPKQAVPVNEQLLQQITDYLGKNGLQSFKNGSQQMTVRLHPDYLGEVTITLIQDKNGIMAKITAAQSMTKDLIQSQLQQLNQGLQSQQIPVNKIEVNQMVYNGQQQSAFYQQQQDSDQQPSQQQSQKDQDLSDDNIPSFEEWLAGEV